MKGSRFMASLYKKLYFILLVLVITSCESIEEVKDEIVGEVNGVFGVDKTLSSTPIEQMTNDEIVKFLFKQNYSPKVHGRYKIDLDNVSKIGKLDMVDSGFLWPDQLGGIANRYKLKGVRNQILYTPYRETDVYSLDRKKLKYLSPAEKIDLLNSDFDYPTVRAEIDRTNVKKIIPNTEDYQPGYQIPGWLNLNRWIAAVLTTSKMNFSNQMVSTNSGLKIEFSRNDLIGLSAWYYFYNNLPINVIASKCPNEIISSRDALLIQNLQKDFLELNSFYESLNDLTSSKKCFKNMSAAAFHVALVNEVGINEKHLILEKLDHRFSIDGIISSYVFNIISERKDNYDVRLELEIYDLLSKKKRSETYKYRLYVDKKKRIIGGAWISKNAPQFVWRPVEEIEFEGYYSAIGGLLKRKNSL